jgi:hypothetical protein
MHHFYIGRDIAVSKITDSGSVHLQLSIRPFNHCCASIFLEGPTKQISTISRHGDLPKCKRINSLVIAYVTLSQRARGKILPAFRQSGKVFQSWRHIFSVDPEGSDNILLKKKLIL